MAEISGFHNSINGDRRVKADFFARFFGSLIGNGVFPNPSTGLQVIANGDMTVTVKTGKAWINGVFYENTADMTLNIDVADGVLKRIDRVVLQFSTLNRTIAAKVKKGTFASSPVAPSLQRDADGFELGLADVLVNNGVISISQSVITDLRLNSNYCGVVTALVNQVDTTTLFNQYQAWFLETEDQVATAISTMLADFQNNFNTWFVNLQDVLDENTSGNLLNMINSLTTRMTVAETAISSLQKFHTAGGTATTITLSNVELTDGFQTTFVILSSNSGSATTINGKQLYKPGTTTAPKLVVGKAATVWYNAAGDCFFIKASSEGTAIAGEVLAGKTFSNDDDTGLTGTLDLSLLTANNIRKNVTVNGVTGNKLEYGSGDTIPIKSLECPMIPTFSFLGFNSSYSLDDYHIDKDGTMYYAYHYSSSNLLFTKASLLPDARGYKYYNAIASSGNFSGESPCQNCSLVFPDNSDYFYFGAARKLYKIKKSDLSVTVTYISGYTIWDMRLSEDGTYIVALCNESSNGTSIYVKKVGFDGTIIAYTDMPNWNWNACFLNNRWVFSQDNSAGCMVDTLSMTKYTVGRLSYYAQNPYDNRKMIREGNIYYSIIGSGGLVGKFSVDFSIPSVTNITTRNIGGGIAVCCFFNYDTDHIFASYSALGQNVLINKSDLTDYCLAQTLPNSNVGQFSRWDDYTNEFIYLDSNGNLNRTYLNLKIK